LISEDTDRSTGKQIGGAAVVAGFVEAERLAVGGEVLLVDSGDMMQGSALSNLTRGAAVIDFMNSAGFDACAIGNHEFDWGIEVLKERIAQAKFPFLCANVFLEEGETRPDWATPSTVVEKAGLKIGIVGVVTTGVPSLVNPKHLGGLRFERPSPIVNGLASRLREGGAQLVVVLAHIGGSQEEDGTVVGPLATFVSELKGVDAVFGGHSHTVVSGTVGTVPVVISASNGRAIGILRLEVDPEGGTSSPVEQSVERTFVEDVAPHEGVESIVASLQKKFAGEMDKVVAVAAEEIWRGRQESPLGNLICDVMRERVGATVAFQNSGGIRSNLGEGPITVREMYKMLPFDNTMVTMYLTGEQIRQLLERGTSENGVVQSSGLSYSYRPQDPGGDRIKHVALEGGTPLQPEELYLVTTNDYMASGGDRYEIFGHGKEIINTQILLRDAVIAWMKALSGAGEKVVAPELGRARDLSAEEDAEAEKK
jgi:2',3'-cyclic-nucleotide 2'-phosphodiesterase/3'-nucleotidase